MSHSIDRQTSSERSLVKCSRCVRERLRYCCLQEKCEGRSCANSCGACPNAGVLKPRGIPLERAVARICREAGARVRHNVLLADMNLDLPVADHGPLLDTIDDQCREGVKVANGRVFKLEPTPTFTTKIRQLYEMVLVRHGVMICGGYCMVVCVCVCVRARVSVSSLFL